MSFADKKGQDVLNKLRVEIGNSLTINTLNAIVEMLRAKGILIKSESDAILSPLITDDLTRASKLIDYVHTRLTHENFITFVNLIGDQRYGNHEPLKAQIIDEYRQMGGDFPSSPAIPDLPQNISEEENSNAAPVLSTEENDNNDELRDQM